MRISRRRSEETDMENLDSLPLDRLREISVSEKARLDLARQEEENNTSGLDQIRDAGATTGMVVGAAIGALYKTDAFKDAAYCALETINTVFHGPQILSNPEVSGRLDYFAENLTRVPTAVGGLLIGMYACRYALGLGYNLLTCHSRRRRYISDLEKHYTVISELIEKRSRNEGSR